MDPPPLLMYNNDIFHSDKHDIPILFADHKKTIHTFPPRDLNTIPDNVEHELLSLSS